MGSTGQRYTAEERRQIIDAMERDVARRGAREPDYTGLSRILGPDPTTLKRWWTQRDAPPPDPGSPSGPTDEERDLASWLLHSDDDAAVIDTLVARGLALAREARAEKSYTAAARAEADVGKIIREHRARKPPTKAGPIDYTAAPAELVAGLVVVPEVVLEAWLALPELWSDPRWVAAREGR